jgi:hypothetical protein
MKHAIDFERAVQATAGQLDSLVSFVNAYPLQAIAWCAVLMAVRSLVYRSRS